MAGLDGYDLKARLSPGYLAVGPIALAVVVLAGEHLDLVKVAASLAVALGVPFIVASRVRDRGKDLEQDLWRSWGGAPATRMLRATASDPDAVDRRLRASRRARLDLPSAQVQREDQEGADLQIQKVVTELIRQTKGDAVVQSELAEYGMRRNILGVHNLGLAVGCLTIGIGAGDLSWGLATDDGSALAAVVIIVIASVAMLSWTRVTPAWVRVAAERYAEALLR
ncbi:MAG: hypothetical protein QOH68_2846 [Nocardioidaceae bacterium]|jgi:hypothetical protein|nr:hypothetical protein [Nocardioidaceae bacterium]